LFHSDPTPLTDLALYAFAKGTIAGYHASLSAYIKFCNPLLLTPPSNKALQLFIIHCYNNGYSYSAANSARSAIIAWCKLHSIKLELSDLTLLALKAFKKVRSRSTPTLWIPYAHLQLLLNSYTPLQIAFFTLIIFSFFTLIRPSEALAIRWSDVNFQHNYVTLQISKTDQLGKGTHVRLLKQARAALNRLFLFPKTHPAPSDFVFPIKLSTLNPWFKTLCGSSDLPPYTWYSLKHGGATHFALLGWNIQKITNHGRWKNPNSARVYIHAPLHT
jgi:integrase